MSLYLLFGTNKFSLYHQGVAWTSEWYHLWVIFLRLLWLSPVCPLCELVRTLGTRRFQSPKNKAVGRLFHVFERSKRISVKRIVYMTITTSLIQHPGECRSYMRIGRFPGIYQWFIMQHQSSNGKRETMGALDTHFPFVRNHQQCILNARQLDCESAASGC